MTADRAKKGRQAEEAPERRLPATPALPDKDRPILQAALAAGSTHLLTGDVRHFGALFGRRVAGIRVLTPGQYLGRLRDG